MRFLVVGQGGREHALVTALLQSPSVTEVRAVPGNEGIAQSVRCHKYDLYDEAVLGAFHNEYPFDCVIIGPENELAAGLADKIRRMGIAVVGPGAIGAQLEASKIFAKDFMIRAGVPTAHAVGVGDVASTLTAAKKFRPPFVLKADGLAAGKGVVICANLEELRAAAQDLFENRTLGSAGNRAMLEKFESGYEISYLILTNGKEHVTLPLAQDHKRLQDGQRGPNTGGMGAIAPMSISSDLRGKIEEQIVGRTLKQLSNDKIDFRGVIFIGIMVTSEGPQVLEYNVRFGDPETQVILPLLDGDWGEVFWDLANGKVSLLKWRSQHYACVVLAAPGYPDRTEKGILIEGDPLRKTPKGYFLHAGTRRGPKGHWLTNGGRVLNAIGYGESREAAIEAAYAQAENVNWIGMQMRTDIGGC